MIRRMVLVSIVLVLFASAEAGLEAQCAMCRTLLSTPEGERIAAALRSGIWVLLAAPFGVFALVAAVAVKSRRRFEATHLPVQPPPHRSNTQ